MAQGARDHWGAALADLETIFAPIKDLEHTDRERWIQGMRKRARRTAISLRSRSCTRLVTGIRPI